MSEADWDSVFAVDLKAAWMLVKAALPGLIERRGAIVNVSSIQARLTLRGFFPYAAAKAGLEGLTRSLALDYAEAGVRVNAIAPGYTETHLVREWLGLQDDPEATLEARAREHPARAGWRPRARSATRSCSCSASRRPRSPGRRSPSTAGPARASRRSG